MSANKQSIIKPIFVVRIKKQHNQVSEDFQEKFLSIQKLIGPQLEKDYHILFVSVSADDERYPDIHFECFNNVNNLDVDLVELQNIINEHVSLFSIRAKINSVGHHIKPIDTKPSDNLQKAIDGFNINDVKESIKDVVGIPPHLVNKHKEPENQKYNGEYLKRP